MIWVKNLKFLLNLFLFQKGLDMMFDGTLGKKVFLDNKNVTKFGEKCAFSKRLTYACGQKVEISSA